jgi:hypothetical protein
VEWLVLNIEIEDSRRDAENTEDKIEEASMKWMKIHQIFILPSSFLQTSPLQSHRFQYGGDLDGAREPFDLG